MRVVVCWAPAQAEYGAAAGHLSLSCRRRVDGWVQRQGSDARQASGTSTVLDEKAARAGGGGGRFPEAPWTHSGEVGRCGQPWTVVSWHVPWRPVRQDGWELGRGLAGSRSGLGELERSLAFFLSLTFFQLHRCCSSVSCVSSPPHPQTRIHHRRARQAVDVDTDQTRVVWTRDSTAAWRASVRGSTLCPSAKPRDGRVGLRGGCPPPARVTSRRLGALASARPPVGLRDTAVSCLLRLRHVAPWRYSGMACAAASGPPLACEPASLPDSCETVWDPGRSGRPPPTPDRPLLSTMEYTGSHSP